MSSALLNRFTNFVAVEAKPKKLFLESWASSIVVLTIIIQFILIAYLLLDSVECAPKKEDPTFLILNAVSCQAVLNCVDC